MIGRRGRTRHDRARRGWVALPISGPHPIARLGPLATAGCPIHQCDHCRSMLVTDQMHRQSPRYAVTIPAPDWRRRLADA